MKNDCKLKESRSLYDEVENIYNAHFKEIIMPFVPYILTSLTQFTATINNAWQIS